MVVWGGFTNSWGKKRNEKRGRESYIQLNAELLKIARRDRKPFFNEQCKNIEENSKKGKTRDLEISKEYLIQK